jgi:hypothetical protein
MINLARPQNMLTEIQNYTGLQTKTALGFETVDLVQLKELAAFHAYTLQGLRLTQRSYLKPLYNGWFGGGKPTFALAMFHKIGSCLIQNTQPSGTNSF